MVHKKTTLDDIAREAGVSAATVSMALSNKGRISDEVRAKIIGVTERMGYVRKQLVKGRTPVSSVFAGILLEVDPEWEFAWLVTRSILAALRKQLTLDGYRTVIVPIDLQEDPGKIEEDISDAGISAVFSIHYANRELFNHLESRGIPVLVVNNSMYQDRFYSVCVDDYQGAYEGAIELIKRGHEKILYIDSERPDMASLVSDRFVGFKKALDEHNLPFSASQRITTRLSSQGDLRRVLPPLLGAADRPTALFAHDDYLGANVAAVLHDLGLGIPADVSLIAHGDCLNYNEPFVPQISTMQISSAMMGTTAAELMAKRLAGDADARHVLKVNQRFVDRGSCAAITRKTCG